MNGAERSIDIGTVARDSATSTEHAELRRLLDPLVAAGAPGAAAWIEDESGVRHAASGAADLRTGRAIQPWLKYRAGSLTKTFVATVVLQMVAERRLSLSDTVERRLPRVLPYGERVTIHQLLAHTSGIPDYIAAVLPALYRSDEARLRAWKPRELIDLVANRPLDFVPGARWSYSNTGYILLGSIIEAVTGKRLSEALSSRIFEPLALDGSSLPLDSARIPYPRLRGYSLPHDRRGKAIDGALIDFTVQNPSYAGAAGALVSTLPDLTRFFRALLGGRLLPPELLAEMLTTTAVPPGAAPLPLYDRYGLAVFPVELPNGRLIGNAGGIPGYLNIVLSTEDGGRQLGMMIDMLEAPDDVYRVFIQAFRELGIRLLR